MVDWPRAAPRPGVRPLRPRETTGSLRASNGPSELNAQNLLNRRTTISIAPARFRVLLEGVSVAGVKARIDISHPAVGKCWGTAQDVRWCAVRSRQTTAHRCR